MTMPRESTGKPRAGSETESGKGGSGKPTSGKSAPGKGAKGVSGIAAGTGEPSAGPSAIAASIGTSAAEAAPPARMPGTARAGADFRPPAPETETVGLTPVAANAVVTAAVNRAPARKTPFIAPGPAPTPSAIGVAPAASRPDETYAEETHAEEAHAKPARAEPEDGPAVPASEPVEAPAGKTAAPSTATSPVRAGSPAREAPAAEAVRPGPPSASFTEINETVLAFVRHEGDAALAHMQALARVRSPAELFRLQVDEFQRAADASLSCIGAIVRSASRMAGPRRP